MPDSLNAPYAAHINRLAANYLNALDAVNESGVGAESILVHSGSETHYFADDRAVPFEPYGHFSHWLPVRRPDQFIWYRPGQTPVYFQVIPDDFWYDQSITMESWWADAFDIVRLGAVAELGAHLGGAIAYLGPCPDLARELGVDEARINTPSLSFYLDFHRAVKSEYEVQQIRTANIQALKGHAAASECFFSGGNEFDIHQAFLAACHILEPDSPYTNIVALDRNAAILHYQHKQQIPAADSQVLLIDAGCRVNGYCSDITRTSVKPTAHPVFRSIFEAMERLQLRLVDEVRPNMAYQELHGSTLSGLADILVEHEVCSGSPESLVEDKIPQVFMPHGTGHLLGVQVHDVGGHQKDATGLQENPPADAPSLRNTRIMEEDMVVTVEPGLYFIPMLLDARRKSDSSGLFNWPLIDELIPFGGIRIEDNVRVRDGGAENLTRGSA